MHIDGMKNKSSVTSLPNVKRHSSRAPIFVRLVVPVSSGACDGVSRYGLPRTP